MCGNQPSSYGTRERMSALSAFCTDFFPHSFSSLRVPFCLASLYGLSLMGGIAET
jgi:hypothetical protein